MQEDRPRTTPADWGEAEQQRFMQLEHSYRQPKPLARGRKGMVVGHSGAFAVRAGVEVLRQGGSAMDAAGTTALAQIALAAGSFISYAGVMNLVYFQAETGKVSALAAGYEVPHAETEPRSIPSPPTPSGRTALVPGFMAGLEAAHQRFGKISFASLFEPAIFIAEEGFETTRLANWIQFRKDVLGRLAETRAVFTKENGEFYHRGDRFRQPALAKTLRAVADHGAQYMYAGPWAEALVEAVQADGGRITLEDLKHYAAGWSDPICTTYCGSKVYGALGRLQMLEDLNILDVANLQQYGHYTRSPEALYWLIQITRIGQLIFDITSDPLQSEFPALPPWRQSFPQHVRVRVTKEHARAVWQKMHIPGWIQRMGQKYQGWPAPDGGHSDGVVGVDALGNVAALSHTVNTFAWGTTGIFVGGISIPDMAGQAQGELERVGPGGRITNPMTPLVILKDTKPVLACTGIGSLHEVMLQCVHNVLEFGMDPKEAAETPHFYGPVSPNDSDGRSQSHKQWVPENGFSEELLQAVRKRGQPLVVATEADGAAGWWNGIVIDHESGERRGGTCPEFNGYALAEDEQGATP